MMSDARGKRRVVVCGEKLLAEQCLEFLLQQSNTEVCGIVAVPKDWQADLISFGAKRRIKVFVGNINDYANELASLHLNFIFSFQYRPLVKTTILKLPTSGCINLHFGLLPRYGGCHPVAWAILNGESQAGATLHYMSEKFDEGDIIAQTSVPVSNETSARELFDTITEAAVKLFADTYPLLCRGQLEPQPQDLSRKLYYAKESIDFSRDRIVNWDKSSTEIQRQICAFSFEPFQLPLSYLQLPDGQKVEVTVSRTCLCQNGSNGAAKDPGRIIEVTDAGNLIVTTSDNKLLEIGLLSSKTPRDFIESLGWSPQDIVFKS